MSDFTVKSSRDDVIVSGGGRAKLDDEVGDRPEGGDGEMAADWWTD